jgi:DNA-directed RNA polymerase subunit E'/Rpb7
MSKPVGSKLAATKPVGSKPVGTKSAIKNTKKMLTIKKTQPQRNLYNQLLITRTIPISINNIGSTIKETLGKAIATQIEGKCIVDGYIKPNSVEIITFSSGLVMGSNVIFEVVIQCEVCSPVEGMHIKCIAKHINKAGIRAEINESPSPVVIFIARDHNYASPLFADVKDNDEIKVRVIGQRFELNDKYISIIAEIVEAEENEKSSPANITIVASGIAPTLPEATLPKATLLAPTLPKATLLAPILPEATLQEPTLQEPTLPQDTITNMPIKTVSKKKATLRIKQPKITVE